MWTFICEHFNEFGCFSRRNLVRVPPLQGGSRGFDSLIAHASLQIYTDYISAYWIWSCYLKSEFPGTHSNEIEASDIESFETVSSAKSNDWKSFGFGSAFSLAQSKSVEGSNQTIHLKIIISPLTSGEGAYLFIETPRTDSYFFLSVLKIFV